MYAFAEKYKYVPKPPVGDWKPGIKRIYLTDEEVKQVPVKGIPYGEAMIKDEQGKYFTEVISQPPKELIEWAEKYNMKIPQWNVPSLKSYENMALSQQYVNVDWWIELKSEIEINLKAYENWFFDVCITDITPDQHNPVTVLPEEPAKNANTSEKAIEIFKTRYPNAQITGVEFFGNGETKDWAISFTTPSQINKGMSIYGTACIDAVTGEVKPATTTAN